MKKLKSRKFWTTIATAAYFAAMAIKEQNDGNQLASIAFGICIGGVIVAWVMIEGFCDHDNEEIIVDETTEAEEGEE